jgi:hypothetical protein
MNISNNNAGSGYAGASGNCYLGEGNSGTSFVNTLGNTVTSSPIGTSLATLTVSTLGYTNVTLSFGMRKSSAGYNSNATYTLEWSNNGTTYTAINYTEPTAMDKIQGFGNDAFSWAKNNPATAGGYALKGVEAINAPPEKVNTSAQQPVRQGQFQGYTPTAAPSRVAPQIVPVPINKTGMLQLDTVVAQNPELRKLYPDLFGG